jgi:ferric-dicitrate binding protein FerR (iron transport regulator)
MQLAAAGPYQMRTDHGSLAVATMPAFGQRGLRILTEDFTVAVTGTRFAVDVGPDGSCVCCLAGTLTCTPAATKSAAAITAGQRCFSARDRSAPDFGAAFAEHLQPVERLPQ